MDVIKPFPSFQANSPMSKRMSLTLVYDDKPNITLDCEMKSESESNAFLEAGERSLLDGVKMILLKPTERLLER